MKLVILTGMSGAGKSTALKMMEDIGFYCVDNLPTPLLEKFIELSETSQEELQKVAIGMDIRNGKALSELHATLERLDETGKRPEILFLDAENSVLVKRYKETRRNHPLSGKERVESGIMTERERLTFLRLRADYIIDTSRLLTRELRAELEKIFVSQQDYKSLLQFFRLGLNMGFRQTQTWCLTCVFCQIPTMWTVCGQKAAMIKRFRNMSFNLKKPTFFWKN